MEILKIKTLYMELTHACNQHCKFCYLDGGIHQKIEEMTTEEIKSIFCNFKNQGGRYAVITGGEPTVRKDCFEILDYINSLGIHFTFASNSLLLNESKLQKLAGYNNLNLYFTSLLGVSEDKHNKIAGNNSYNKVFETLKFLDDREIPTYVQCTLINDYIDDMPAIAEKLIKFKKCTMKFTPAASLGIKKRSNDLESILVPEERFKYFNEKVNELKDKYKGRIEDSNLLNFKQVNSLIDGYKNEKLYSLSYGFLAVRPDGTKSFSCNMGNPYVFGNARDKVEINIDKRLMDYTNVLREAEAFALLKSRRSIIEFDMVTDNKIKDIYAKKFKYYF